MSDEKAMAEAEEAADGRTEETEAPEPRRPAEAPGRRRGRPSRARGRPLSSDEAAFRWTVRGVPVQVRALALKAAEERGMTVGDWLAEAIVAFARGDGQGAGAGERRSNLPTTERPPDLLDMIQRIDERLTALEQRRPRGLFERLFGRRD